MEQNALIDEALARLHDAECAIRRLQAPNTAHDTSTGKLNQHASLSLQAEKDRVSKPPEEEPTSPATVNLPSRRELMPPPDIVIADSTLMNSRIEEDASPFRGMVIFVQFGAIKLSFLHPESYIRLWWLVLGMVFTFVDALFIPYTLAFEVQAEGEAFRWVVDIYFLLDIVVNFFTAYLNEMGVLVSRPVDIWRRYVTGWFIFDFVAAFPWQLAGIEGVSRLTRNLRVVRALRLTKILRVARVIKLKYLMEKIEPFIEGNHMLVFFLAILRVLITLFMVCHWCACAWYDSVESDVSWLSKLPEDVQELDPLIHHSQLYLWSLYYTLTTMTTVGYGDITPTTTTEAYYAIIFLGISAIVFAGQLGMLSDHISNLNRQGAEMQDKKATLARYMNWRIVPMELRASIRKHCLFLWEKNEGNDAYEDTLKDFLPPVLRQELCNHIYGGVIRNAPFLAWMAEFPTVVKFLANAVENTFWSKGDFIFRYDTLNQSIQILLAGQVRLSKNERIVHEPLVDPTLGVQDRFYVPNKNVKKQVQGFTQRVLQKQLSIMSTKKSNKWATKVAVKDDVIDPVFQSGMFITSWRNLIKDDKKQVEAAKRLQCQWRKRRDHMLGKQRSLTRKLSTKENMSGPWNQPASSMTGVKNLITYSIKAPAFFGESCLWQPTLGSAQPYGYSAQCEKLSETLAIEVMHVQDLLQRFSPWLSDRFERFREHVSAHHAAAGSNGSMQDDEGDTSTSKDSAKKLSFLQTANIFANGKGSTDEPKAREDDDDKAVEPQSGAVEPQSGDAECRTPSKLIEEAEQLLQSSYEGPPRVPETTTSPLPPQIESDHIPGSLNGGQ